MKKGKAIPILQVKADKTVTSLNNLTDDITILSNDNANIQVTTEGQAIKIDSSQVSANKADIATNFNKYLAGLDTNGRTSKNNDCNSAIVNGRWFSEGKPNDPNAPNTANGILETYRPTSGSLYQRYTPYNDDSYFEINRFYQRRGSNVDTEIVWSEWTMFSTEQTTTNTAAITTNKTDIATNFNKYLAGIQKDGTCIKNSDCNSAIVNGRWYSEGKPNDPNAPNTANGILETYRPTSRSLYQRYTPYNADSYFEINLFFQRSGSNVDTEIVWSEWTMFSTEQTTTNTAAIATNFNKYLAGLSTNGRTSRNNDCNNALVNGRWYSEGSDEDPNAPTGSNGILETYRATTGSVYQKYTPYSAVNTSINRFFQRSGTDASTKVVWSKWVEFSTTINGLIVGTLLWNDTTAKAMGSNMMPASGIHYLDPVIFPELFEKVGYTNGRKGDLFKVGIDTTYPYLSMVKSGRGVGSTETDAIRNITGTKPVGAFQNITSTGCFYNNGKQTRNSAEGGNRFWGIDFSLSRGLSGGSSHIQSTIHPANTACYLNRVASTGQNEALEQALKDTSLLTVRCIATKDNLEGFAENELMGEMEVPFNYHTTQWHYDNENEDNKIIIDKVEYWISESQTKVEPLEVKKGFTQLFKDDKFEYIEDHREEEVYLKTDGSLFTITELGEIPNEYTTIAPPTYAQYYKFNTDKWVLDSSKKNELIEVLWTSLSEKRDYITDKLFEYKGYNININKDSKDDLHDLYLDASDAKMELTLLSQISNRTPEQEAEYQNLLKWEVVWICNKIELTDDVKVDTELKLTLNDAIALDQLRRKYRSNEVFDIHNIQITLKNKTMEELIDLLNTKEIVI